MIDLDSLAHRERTWSLEGFVQAANRLLPDYLPEDRANTRVGEDVNPRLVRLYATQGLLDPPLKEGREARYTRRHLLQMLAARRLLADGVGTSVITRMLDGRDETELAELLQGGSRQLVEAPNAAVAFLQGLESRREAGGPPPSSRRATVQADATAPQGPTRKLADRWVRIEVEPGLELTVREGFRLPADRGGQQALAQQILDSLMQASREAGGTP